MAYIAYICCHLSPCWYSTLIECKTMKKLLIRINPVRRVLCSAAHLVWILPKFSLSAYMRDVLHWLHSATRGELLVPWSCLAIMQRRAFSVVHPSAWNDLLFELHFMLFRTLPKSPSSL